jgi:cytochrome o ubiquinol oxidase subunit 2
MRKFHYNDIGRLRSILLAIPIALTGCKPAVLDPGGPIGLAEKTILIDSVAIMLAIGVPTMIATLCFAWWFRASNARATYQPDWEYSGRIELVVWSIPLLVILLLGGVAWIGSHQLDPAEKIASDTPPLEVQVVSLDWKWLFIYPDQRIASVNELTIPAGVPVHFSLTSGSVMSAFFIPRLGSMIYTMGGMATQLNLRADEAGDYLGEASQYSGDGFAGMRFAVHAVPRTQFNAWIETAQGGAKAFDSASYIELSRQSINVSPETFRLTDPQLFHKIVTAALPPGPGPESGGQHDPAVSPRMEH